MISDAESRSTRRTRLLAGLAFVLSLSLALFVLLYWRDGNWLLVVPAAASMLAVMWPRRVTIWIAIAATGLLVFLGAVSVGYFFIPSLVSLMVALDAIDRVNQDVATA